MMISPQYYDKYVRDVRDTVRKPFISNPAIDNAAQLQVALRGGWDRVWFEDVKNGRLNRNEFVALQMYQAETERLKSKFLSDGLLDDRERNILESRRKDLLDLYKKYYHGDYNPSFNAGGIDDTGSFRNYIYDRKLEYQYGKIYDGIVSGQMTEREYLRADNNIESIQRYRGTIGEYPRFFSRISGIQHQLLRNSIENNDRLIYYYNNNWEREWWRWILL